MDLILRRPRPLGPLVRVPVAVQRREHERTGGADVETGPPRLSSSPSSINSLSGDDFLAPLAHVPYRPRPRPTTTRAIKFFAEPEDLFCIVRFILPEPKYCPLFTGIKDVPIQLGPRCPPHNRDLVNELSEFLIHTFPLHIILVEAEAHRDTARDDTETVSDEKNRRTHRGDLPGGDVPVGAGHGPVQDLAVGLPHGGESLNHPRAGLGPRREEQHGPHTRA